ncbi:MAG: 50S ribosomal protein L4 [Gammaproteobacteria bacterium RIFCSPHIGHO2_12_FULL_41_20]|nr:MAG: 50S ribosomal protein L4 [Gammaproteobacteria bacterium RIFCSPHIGHO2_12_FULL_41_20]
MELEVINSKKKLTLSDEVFAKEFNEPLIHQVVTAYLATGRAGTQSQKTRAEVSGGGIKPWRQKGTGRARAGTIRSPIWRKGGVTFAAKPRSYKQKVNKKMYNVALRSILSELVRQERLAVVDAITLEKPKTKALLAQLAAWKLSDKVLIITESVEHNLYLAARNLPHVNVFDVTASLSDPVALVGAEKLLVTKEAMQKIEELLK